MLENFAFVPEEKDEIIFLGSTRIAFMLFDGEFIDDQHRMGLNRSSFAGQRTFDQLDPRSLVNRSKALRLIDYKLRHLSHLAS